MIVIISSGSSLRSSVDGLLQCYCLVFGPFLYLYISQCSNGRLHGWQYEFERRRFAQDLIEFDRKFSALFSEKPRTEEKKDAVRHEELATWV